MRGLLVRTPYIDQILDGEKKEEYRKRRTHIRGRIALIACKTRLIFGEVSLIDCIPKKTDWGNFSYVLRNPVRYKFPKPCQLKNGVQVWVKLAEAPHGS